jgi:uncharacterized protein
VIRGAVTLAVRYGPRTTLHESIVSHPPDVQGDAADGPNVSLPRIVPDTNVFVAAFWNPRSAALRVLRMAEDGRVRLCLTPDTISEIRYQVTRQPLSSEYRGWVEGLVAIARVKPAAFELDEIPEDRTDNRFLEAAVAHDADALMTNDRHLLQLRQFAGTPILPPGETLRRVLLAPESDAPLPRERGNSGRRDRSTVRRR